MKNGLAEYVNGMDVTGRVILHDGLEVEGNKNFRMTHPLAPDQLLRHGSTESPVSGVEYWGTGRLEVGVASVTLPDYFEALTKPNNRAVLVSAISSPEPIAATEIRNGAFTVHGIGDSRFTWLVKAERIGADFEAEGPAEPDTND